MTNIELQYYNVMMANMESIAKSLKELAEIAKLLKELAEVVKSIKNSTVKVPDDTETK